MYVFADDLKIYLKIRHSNIVCISSDLSSCQIDIDTVVHAASSRGLQLDAEKFCVMRFARKKSSIKILDITQFQSYYVRGMDLPFVYSRKDLAILLDTELQFHGHIRSLIGKSSEMLVNLLNSTLCRSRENM